MALKLDIHDLDDLIGAHAPHLLAPQFGIAPSDTSALVAKPSPDTAMAPAVAPPKPGFQAGAPPEATGPGTTGFYRQKISDIENKRANPWGTEQNHPGFLGKLGHIAGTVGNIAGDIFAPGITALIPGSQLNMSTREGILENKLGKAEEEERQKGNTESEEKLRESQGKEAEARAKELENPSEKRNTENLQQGYADAIRDALQNGRDPSTDPHVLAWKSAIAEGQKPKEPKHSSGELRMSEGIPTGIYGENDKLFRAGDPNMPDDLKAALEDAKKAHGQKVQEGLNQAREGRAVYAGSRGVNVMNADGEIIGVNGLELPQFMKENPGSVIVGTGAPTQAMGKQALLGDIRQSAENVRKNLDVLDRKGFDFAKLATALADTNSTMGEYLQAIPRGSLDENAQQFVSDLFNLREQAMAMRSVLGAGQGSEDLRQAIIQTLPGISSGSSGFGKKQLDNMIAVLGRLEKGVPKVPMRGGNATGGGESGNYPKDVKVPDGWEWATVNGKIGIKKGDQFRPYNAK